MKTETFTGEVLEYQGTKLDKPISYSGTANLYSTVEEAKASEDWPNESGILKDINKKKLTAAKAAEYQKQTADLKKNYENSPEYKKAEFIKSAIAMGFSRDKAEALAESAVA